MTGQTVTRCLIGTEQNQGKESTMVSMLSGHPLVGLPVGRETNSTTRSMCGETTTGLLILTWTVAIQETDGLRCRGFSVAVVREGRCRRSTRVDVVERQEERSLSRPTTMLAGVDSSMSSTTTTVNVKLKISPVSNHFFNSFPNIKITVSSHGDFFQIIVDGGKHVVFIAHKLNYISKINKLAKLRRHASRRLRFRSKKFGPN